ncbi:MAG TPA: ATP-binding protein [Chloroflexota bacterium]
MRWFHTSRTSRNLLAWFVAVYLLLAGGSLVSLTTTGKIRQSVDAFDTTVLPGTILLAKSATAIHQAVDDSHTIPSKGIRPTAPPEVQAQVRQQNFDRVQADLIEIQGYIDNFSALPLGTAERKLAGELQSVFDEFRAVDQRMVPHMLIGTDEEIGIGRSIGQQELSQKFDQLDTLLAQLMELSEGAAHVNATAALSAEEWAQRTLAVVLATGLVLVIGIGLYVGRSISRQIAERERAEDALRVGDRAMAATNTAIAISDVRLPNSGVVYVNPAFERLTGYAAAEVMGRRLDVLAGPDPDPETRRQIGLAHREQRDALVSTTNYRKDGSSFACELALAPVRDTDGHVTHFVWLLNDITERKRAEAQAETLARTEKLRALGQMASGIAHDLNQSLMLIASYGDLAKRALDEETPNRDEMREMFTVIGQAALDGGQTLKRLLQFTRAPMNDTATALDLTLLAREVAQLTAPRWRDAAQAEGRPIKLDVETNGHPIVLGSAAALRDAIMNLLLNATDALPQGGTIKLRVFQADQNAVLEVVDDGVGMAPDVQSRVFEPFFTTKADKGTGLGLASVFGLVERLGGQIGVDSVLGRGTTFRLSFPLQLAMPAAVSEVRPPVEPGSEPRQLRILAVDDEPALTKAVVRLLRPRGHVVMTASCGEEALERLAQSPFDVVLSDVGMGEGMNGWELAARVREMWPDTRVVLATGWGAAIDPEDARAKGITAVLAKPYSCEELDQILAA